MSDRRCPRAWQAEAVLDRRLSREDGASFERHLTLCQCCTGELRELSKLKALGRRLVPPSSDSLQRRRRRNELLRQAHGGERMRGPSVRARWAIGMAALLLVLGWLGHRRLHSVAPLEQRGPVFDVEARAGTDWRRLREGEAVRLQLARGEVTIQVSSLEAGQSFILTLPDGELEVRGTRFIVTADAESTKRVVVTEGRVALRLHGRRELILGAGDFWEPAPAAAAPSSRSDGPERDGSEREVVVTPTPPSPRAVRDAGAVPPAPSASAVVKSGGGSDSTVATDFALAMASFSRGDFATAEQLFLRFEARHPSSSQVEDSSFLRSVTRLRRGDTIGARALASEYLQRYPNGFRAAEAERIRSAP